MPINKTFAEPNEDRRKKRGNTKESGFMKQSGLQIVTHRRVVYNTPCYIWQFVAQIEMTEYNLLINSFIDKTTMARRTFKVLFYVNGTKEKNGIAPIKGRITINGTMTRFSCNPIIPKTLLEREIQQGEGQELPSTRHQPCL